MHSYATAIFATPILNRPDFSYVFGGYPQGILLDDKGLLRSLEMVALKGAVFTIIQEVLDGSQIIYEVLLDDYPSPIPLYIDSRFVRKIKEKPNKVKKEFPHPSKILKNLQSFIGLPYVWGGNFSQGVPQLMDWYPPKRILTSLEKANWSLCGIDCSGLLYEATEGLTPRNTSELFSFGVSLEIENNTVEEIVDKLDPLDLILWNGHVVIVFDQNHTIESRAHRGGVFLTSLKQRLKQINEEEKKRPLNCFRTKEDLNTGFIVRRGSFK